LAPLARKANHANQPTNHVNLEPRSQFQLYSLRIGAGKERKLDGDRGDTADKAATKASKAAKVTKEKLDRGGI
jgi:hypothetical protein